MPDATATATETQAKVEPVVETKAETKTEEVKTEVKPTTETKTETQVKSEEKKETLLGAAKIVPEKYELKLPDGSPLDKEALTRVENYAKANKLSNEEAQNLLEVENTAVKAFANKAHADSEAAKASWLEASKNDQEVGGQNLAQNVEMSRRVVEKFGSPLLKQIFNDTGTGNHPELIRMLSRIGKAIGEDQLVVGKVGSQPEKVPAEKKLYPNQK